MTTYRKNTIYLHLLIEYSDLLYNYTFETIQT